MRSPLSWRKRRKKIVTKNCFKMEFDFSHTWLNWYEDEKEWYSSFFTNIYPVYCRHHDDKSDAECQKEFNELVSEIVSIIAKGLFVKAGEVRRAYYFYNIHKKANLTDHYYNDQANIKKFLLNLDSATEIEFELRPCNIRSDLLRINDTFPTIMAINIKWLDSEYKTRKYNGHSNGGRIEASLHFHELFLRLGWEEGAKIKTHIYKESDEDFQSYIDIVRDYFSRFIDYKHYTKGMGLKEFGKECHELATYLNKRIDELSSESAPSKTTVAIFLLDLFRIPNDLDEKYDKFDAKVEHDVFARYLTVS